MARVKNTRQIMEVMQAYLDGKKIERRHARGVGKETMWRVSKTPDWNWNHFDYRVKQEPREFAVVIDREGKAIGVSEAAGGSIITVPGDKIRDAKVIRVREVLDNE